jgi:hypothetical protein
MARKPKTAVATPPGGGVAINPGGLNRPVPASAKQTKAQQAGHARAGKTTHAKHVAALKKLNQQRAKHGLPALKHIPSGSTVSNRKHRRLVAPRGFLVSRWIMGYNDVADTCVAAAIANSMLLCTGESMSEGNILSLAQATEGASIQAGLSVLYEMGLCHGYYPVYKRIPGFVAGVQLPEGPHALTFGNSGVITWGDEVALGRHMDPLIEEAWLIDWPTKERT